MLWNGSSNLFNGYWYMSPPNPTNLTSTFYDIQQESFTLNHESLSLHGHHVLTEDCTCKGRYSSCCNHRGVVVTHNVKYVQHFRVWLRQHPLEPYPLYDHIEIFNDRTHTPIIRRMSDPVNWSHNPISALPHSSKLKPNSILVHLAQLDRVISNQVHDNTFSTMPSLNCTSKETNAHIRMADSVRVISHGSTSTTQFIGRIVAIHEDNKYDVLLLKRFEKRLHPRHSGFITNWSEYLFEVEVGTL